MRILNISLLLIAMGLLVGMVVLQKFTIEMQNDHIERLHKQAERMEGGL